MSAEFSGDEAYGMSIIITKLNGKENVVIFRQNAANMLHSFYNYGIRSYLKHAIGFQKGNVSFEWIKQATLY